MQAKSEALPEEFVSRLRREFAPEVVDAILDGMTVERRVSFRLNRLHAQCEEALHLLEEVDIPVEPIPCMPDAYSVARVERQRLLESVPAVEGMVYVQNASSQIPPMVLAPVSGESVLDLAAAPGSKTLQLSALMQNCGEIAAVELVKARFFRMNALLKEYGATNVRTFLKNGMDVWRHRPEHFDRVLLDAPCASEGRFHIDDPESVSFWNPRKVREMVRKQRRLLFSAVQALKPGGSLVYSTCSLSLDENEGVLSDILERFEGALESVPLGVQVQSMIPPAGESHGRTFHPQLAEARRILPGVLHEGFFVAHFRKTHSTLDR